MTIYTVAYQHWDEHYIVQVYTSYKAAYLDCLELNEKHRAKWNTDDTRYWVNRYNVSDTRKFPKLVW